MPATLTDVQAERRTAYLALLAEFFVDPSRTNNTSNEDAGIWLAGENGPLAQFAAVTVAYAGRDGLEINYVYPAYDHWIEAAAKAVRHAADSAFYEIPQLVVDLDTGQRWEPNWSALPWTPQR